MTRASARRQLVPCWAAGVVALGCGGWQKGDALKHVNQGKWPTEEVAAQARALALKCDDDSGAHPSWERAEDCWRVGSLIERWSGNRDEVKVFQDRACEVDSRECR